MKVAPDADEDETQELDEIGKMGTSRNSGLVKPISKVPSRKTEWLWPGYIARREMSILDGEKGVAKSLVITDPSAPGSLLARLCLGLRPVPARFLRS